MTGKLITGKVLTEDGFPMAGAVIKEIPKPGYIGAADVYADGTGAFTMQALNNNSTIEVSAEGFGTLQFPNTSAPFEIRMVIEEIIIEVNRKKKDNTLLYLGLGALAVTLALASSKSKPAAKGTSPATKKLSKPKVVEV